MAWNWAKSDATIQNMDLTSTKKLPNISRRGWSPLAKSGIKPKFVLLDVLIRANIQDKPETDSKWLVVGFIDHFESFGWVQWWQRCVWERIRLLKEFNFLHAGLFQTRPMNSTYLDSAYKRDHDGWYEFLSDLWMEAWIELLDLKIWVDYKLFLEAPSPLGGC